LLHRRELQCAHDIEVKYASTVQCPNWCSSVWKTRWAL